MLTILNQIRTVLINIMANLCLLHVINKKGNPLELHAIKITFSNAQCKVRVHCHCAMGLKITFFSIQKKVRTKTG